MKISYCLSGIWSCAFLCLCLCIPAQGQGDHNTCYIIRPVFSPSNLEKPKDFNPISDLQFKEMVKSYKTSPYQVDSLMEYITGYSHQKVISIDYDCFAKLTNPKNSFLIEIFLNSMYNTNSIIDGVEFSKSYEKRIHNFGQAIVFEYVLEGVVESAPHRLVIITEKKENKYEEDIKGIALCSNGVDWISVENREVVLSIIDRVRIGKEYEILTFFDGRRFIPIAHHKIGSW